MKLQPVSQPTHPSYPTHRRRFAGVVKWLRRGAVAAAAVAALGVGGCYGATPFGSDPDDTTSPVEQFYQPDDYHIPPISEFPEDMAGGERAPGFQCEAPPDWYVAGVPAYLDGPLCGDETSYASFDVIDGGAHTIFFEVESEYVFLDMLTPEGVEVALLGPDRESITLELAPGRHVLAANAADPIDHPNEWFTIRVVAGEL